MAHRRFRAVLLVLGIPFSVDKSIKSLRDFELARMIVGGLEILKVALLQFPYLFTADYELDVAA